MALNYAKLLRLLHSDSEVIRSHAAFAGADIIESLQARIGELQAKVEELTKAITDFREGNYANSRSYRPNDCPHGTHYWQECANCDEEYWQSVLQEGE